MVTVILASLIRGKGTDMANTAGGLLPPSVGKFIGDFGRRERLVGMESEITLTVIFMKAST